MIKEITRGVAVDLVRESSVKLPRCNEVVLLNDGRVLMNRGKRDKPKYLLRDK
jgi:hypothetical protein